MTTEEDLLQEGVLDDPEAYDERGQVRPERHRTIFRAIVVRLHFTSGVMFSHAATGVRAKAEETVTAQPRGKVGKMLGAAQHRLRACATASQLGLRETMQRTSLSVQRRSALIC